MTNLQLIADFAKHARHERNLSENTVDAYTTDLLQFAEQLERTGAHTLLTADKDDVAAFLVHLSEHSIGAVSKARKTSALRGLYKWLIHTERLELDPMRRTVAQKLPKRLPKPVEQDSLREILAAAGKRAEADDATPQERRDYALLEVLYGSGLRASECCGLQLDGLSLREAKAVVLGKGNKERIVPLGSPTVAAIRNYLAGARQHLVKRGREPKALFLSDQGRQISYERVWQIVRRHGGDLHVHPHRLRHSCATHMLDNDADIRVIQELLGHADLNTTQSYTQVSKGKLQDAHARYHPRG